MFLALYDVPRVGNEDEIEKTETRKLWLVGKRGNQLQRPLTCMLFISNFRTTLIATSPGPP